MISFKATIGIIKFETTNFYNYIPVWQYHTLAHEVDPKDLGSHSQPNLVVCS